MAVPYIAYRHNQELKVGKVIRDQKGKLLVADPNGRTESLKAAAVIARFSGSSDPDEGRELALRIKREAQDVEVALLWEIMVDGTGEFDGEQAAEEYFGAASAVQIAAATKALLEDQLHFRRKGAAFLARTRAEVDDLLLRDRREAERAAREERVLAFLEGVLSRKPVKGEISDEIEGALGRVEAYMFRDQSPEAEQWLTRLGGRRPPREVGLEVLERLGRLHRNVDPQLLLYGIVAEFSETVTGHADALPAFSAVEEQVDRSDFRRLAVFSIDDESTEEVDDALSWEPLPDGGCEVGIHIADPSVFVAKDDCVDRVAAERALTLYLATCTVTMLPPRIGCDLASLNHAVDRPSISVLARFSESGELRDYAVERGRLRVAQRFSYEDVDTRLGEPEAQSDDAMAEPLRCLSQLADSLRRQRLAAGALLFSRPEISVKVRDDRISIARIEPDTPARRLVSEFMILANRLVAEFALARDIPIIYRTQPAPAEPVEPPAVYDPVLFDRCVRKLRPTRFSTHPQPHSSLGLDVYTQISSPLRRFNDLAIHRQLAACLNRADQPYSVVELIEVLGRAEVAERANKRIEREVANFWLLEALRRDWLGKSLPATVVDPVGNTVLAELDDFLVRGLLQGGGRHRAGAHITVRVADVQPRRKTMLLQPV